MQRAAAKQLVAEGSDDAVRLHPEIVADGERKAAGGDAFAFVRAAAAFHRKLTVRTRHGRLASNGGSAHAKKGYDCLAEGIGNAVHGATWVGRPNALCGIMSLMK